MLLLSRFSHVRLCVTPQTAAHQAPLFLGFSRQEHWSGLPFPSPTEAASAFFHGACNGRLVVIGPINLPVGRLFVEEVIVECRKRAASRVDLLAFEFEMGLFPAVLDEADRKS